MLDYMDIGGEPAAEECFPFTEVGHEQFNAAKSKKVCRIFIEQIRRQLGDEPFGASLRVKTFHHEHGDYHEVVCYYNDNDADAADYAMKCQNEMPQKWDEEALKELEKAELTTLVNK